MKELQLPNTFLNQSKDSLWMVNLDFKLIYANKTYLSILQTITGKEQILYDSVFLKDDIEKRKAYYNRAFKGEYFEIEDHYYDSKLKEIQYGQTTFEPLTNEDNKIFAVACRWKNVTNSIKHRKEENQLMDASLDVFCTFNADGEFVYASEASKKHWGYAPEELIGKRYIEMTIAEDVSKTAESATAIESGNETKTFHNRYRKKDGGIAYNLWSSRWDDATKLFYSVARDNQEQVEQEEKIKQSEQRFKALVQEGADLFAIIDKTGHYIYMSPSSTKIVGIPPEAFIGRDAFEFLHPDDIESALESLKKVTTQDRVVMEHYRAKNDKNEWRWVETVLTNMLNNPAVKGIVVNSKDITNEVEEKRHLKLLESVITNTNDAVLITEAEPFDEPGPKIIYVNEAFTKMTGYTAEEVIGKTPRILQGPNSDREQLAKLSKAIRNWESYEITSINYKENGDEFWINFTVIPVANEKGLYTHWVAIQRDITESKLVNEKLIEAKEKAEENEYSIREAGRMAKIGYWSYDKEKYIISWSDEIHKIYGTNIEKGVPNLDVILSFFTEKSKKEIVEATIELASKGTPYELELNLINSKNENVWIRNLGHPVYNEQNEIVGRRGVSQNITKEKNTQLALLKAKEKAEENEHKMKEAQKLAHLGSWYYDVINKVSEWSEETYRIWGLEPEVKTVELSNHKDLVHPKDWDRFGAVIKDAIEKGASYKIEIDLIMQDGAIKTVNSIGTPIFNENNKVIALRGTTQDITERKAIENELRIAKEKAEENERKMKEAQKLAHLGSWYYDVINKVSEWSEETYNIWGFDPQNTSLEFLDHQKRISPKDWKYFNAVVENATEKGIPYKMELELIMPNGAKKIVDAIAEPIFNEKNQVIAYKGTTQDITERIAIENELRSAKERAEKSEYTMSQASKLAKIGYWYYDAATQILTWSDYIYRLYNLTPEDDIPSYEEAKGHFDSQSQEKITKATKKLDKNGTPYDLELRMINSKNEEIWVRNVVQPVYNDQKEIVGKRGVIQNITEEKKIKELNRLAAKLTKYGSFEIDLIKETLFWTEEIHEICETDPNTYLPNLEDALNFYRDDSRKMVEEILEKVIQEGGSWDYEAVIVTKNKKEKWIRSVADTEFINGKCVRIYGGFQDISIRKQSEDRLLSLAENLPGLIYEYHMYPDGTDAVVNVNGKVEEIWGFTANEVKGDISKAWKQIELAGDLTLVQTSVQKSIETNSKWQVQFKYVRPNTGKLHTHLGVGSPSFLADGTIVINAMVLDITEEAKNEALLEQTNKIAKIGSWEMDLINQEGANMYWSSSIKEILEIDINYTPTLKDGIEFHIGESRGRIEKALMLLINEGVEFDEEVLLRTTKGNERWCRAIGKSEVINGKRTRIYGSYQDIHERKNATLDLKKSLKSLEDYKYSLDQAAIIASTNQKGEITSVNDNFCKISGFKQHEVIGKTHRILNSNHHTGSFFKELWKTIASGKVWRGEVKNKAKDGSYYWVDTTIVPFLNEKNKPTQYLAIRFDITERKKVEEEKTRFQETLESSLNEIYMFDAETFKFNYVNKGAQQNLGYTKKELTALTPLDLKPDFTVASFRELVKPLKSYENDKVVFFTNHKRKDGSLYPVEIHLTLVEDLDDKNFIAIVLDITERKKAEEMYRLLANNTNDIIALQSTNSELKYISPSVETVLGYTPKELMHTEFFDLIHKDDIKNVKEAINENILKGENLLGLTFRIRHKNGNFIWLEKSISPIIEDNKVVSLVVSNRDITQWMLAKKEIEDYQSSLQRLTSEISLIEEKQKKEIAANIHDHLSQSLVISRMRIVDLEKKPELKNIQEDLGFIRNHISEALENSRKITYELSPPVLYQLGLIDALEWYADETEEKYGIKFQFKSNIDTVKLTEFKSILLFRCVQEAVTNCIKYAEASLITLEVIKDKNALDILITDNGKGFDTTNLNSSRSHGSGFGLFAVNERIKNMNGKLTISSEIKIGTKIKIYVPL